MLEMAGLSSESTKIKLEESVIDKIRNLAPYKNWMALHLGEL
jgi:hypothetical protein